MVASAIPSAAQRIFSANFGSPPIRDTLKKSGFPLLYETSANQTFVTFKNETLDFFASRYAFEVWGKPDDEHTTVRICTSWATEDTAVQELIDSIKAAGV